MSSQKLWVEHQTTAKSYGPSRVSIDGCEYVDDFLKEIKKVFSNALSGYDANQLTLYQLRDGQEVEIDVGDSPADYVTGNSRKNPLFVKTAVVAPLLEKEMDGKQVLMPASRLTFVEFLNRGRINRPDKQVLATIAKRYSQQLHAVLEVGATEPCIDLYETVKALPSSFTRGVIQSDMKISINGPVSLAQPNILIAVDLNDGKHLFIKLLRIPQTTTSESTLSKKDAVTAEVNACVMLSKANILGLVKCDVVEVTVHHSEDLDVSPGVWAALKMKRYMSSLTDIPQLSENWLYCGFTRILKALKAMHELKLVHMDVKSDNLFVDVDFNWDLGDFGSTRAIGALVWSYTKVLNPYAIPPNASVIPAMDFVLLCVTIAIELKKDQWKNLCGQQQNVQEHLIIAELNSIENRGFRKEVVELFEHNVKIVREHFQNY